jgi:hypothetical protein
MDSLAESCKRERARGSPGACGKRLTRRAKLEGLKRPGSKTLRPVARRDRSSGHQGWIPFHTKYFVRIPKLTTAWNSDEKDIGVSKGTLLLSFYTMGHGINVSLLARIKLCLKTFAFVCPTTEPAHETMTAGSKVWKHETNMRNSLRLNPCFQA